MQVKTGFKRLILIGAASSLSSVAIAAQKRPAPAPAKSFYACVYQISEPNSPCTPIEVSGIITNADAAASPASLNKLMTAHLILQDMAANNKKLDDPFTYVSREDAEAGRMGERNGKPITDGRTLRYRKDKLNPLKDIPEDHVFSYRDFVNALLVFSANDFAAAAARKLAPAGNFGDLMTAEAHKIGMKNTVFKTASGMPATGQKTTAEDMSKLIYHLVRTYPSGEMSDMFGQSSTVVAGQPVPGHLRLLKSRDLNRGKTGFDNGGSNLAGSSERGNYGISFSTLGSPNALTRDSFTKRTLNKIFNMLGVGTAHATPPEEPKVIKVSPKETHKKKAPPKARRHHAPPSR